MHHLIHLAVVVVVAIVLSRFAPAPRPWTIALAGACALLPLPVVWLAGSDEVFVTGTEGLLEAVTEGLLVALAVRAVRQRCPVVALAAALLFLEEVDYGQLFLGFTTPAWVQALSPRSDQTNFHNIPEMDWFWRLLPILIVLALSFRPLRPAPLERACQRLALPCLHRSTWLGLAIAVGAGALTMFLCGERRGDEARELALTAVVFCAWLDPRRRVSEAPGPERAGEGLRPA